MSTQSLLGRSPQLVALEAPKSPNAPSIPQNQTSELIDTDELARRLNLPASWIRSHCRARTTDEVPHHTFGRWIRFDWNSPKLQQWIRAHEDGRD